MQILNALDAISPAFSRTKLVIFSPFRMGRTWKLAATAYLSIMGTMFLPYPLIAFYFIPLVHQFGGRSGVAILVSVTTAITFIYLWIFYLCSRLRFAYFDIVSNRGEFVAPAWRKYGAQSFKWTAFKVGLGTLAIAAVALPMSAYIKHLIAGVASMHLEQGQTPLAAMFTELFTGYAVILFVYLLLGLFFWGSSLLSDFIVPSLALEDTTIELAFQRLGQLIRREPGQFVLYALLKMGLAISGYIAQMIVFCTAIIVVFLVVGLVEWTLGMLLHAGGVPMAVLSVIGMIVSTLLMFFLMFYGMFLGMGTVLTFLEAYALYFLGGRYPMLGELLDRSTPPVYRPEPVYPPYLPPSPPAMPLE
jgi:hypothetical protein